MISACSFAAVLTTPLKTLSLEFRVKPVGIFISLTSHFVSSGMFLITKDSPSFKVTVNLRLDLL